MKKELLQLDSPKEYVMGDRVFLGYNRKLYVECSYEVFEMLLAPKEVIQNLFSMNGKRELTKEGLKDAVSSKKTKSGTTVRRCGQCGEPGHRREKCASPPSEVPKKDVDWKPLEDLESKDDPNL